MVSLIKLLLGKVTFHQLQYHTHILLQDEEFIVFPDIRPAAPHHYLVLTREHLIDAKCLTKEHIPMGKTVAPQNAWEPNYSGGVYVYLLRVVLSPMTGDGCCVIFVIDYVIVFH